MKSCQAREQAIHMFGDSPSEAPPSCDGFGEVEVAGYLLCEGCAYALEAIVAIGGACLRHQGDEVLRQLGGES